MFQQITILGPGLLGASLAMAAKERGLAQRVVAWSRRAETRAKCADQGWCDAVFETALEAVAGSDLIVVCTPVQTIAPLLEAVGSGIESGALVTDVGSTKAEICTAMAGRAAQHFEFVGSHPMAGSEKAGLEHAHGRLFEGAACIVTPLPEVAPIALMRLSEFWAALGMRVQRSTPEEHDAIVANVSHLPHLLASTVCSHLANKDALWAGLSGGGLRDSTRVAGGDPGLWQQILEQNQVQVLAAIRDFETELQRLKSALERLDSEQIHAFLARGKQYRDQLPSSLE